MVRPKTFCGFFVSFFSPKKTQRCIFRVLKYFAALNPKDKKREGRFWNPFLAKRAQTRCAVPYCEEEEEEEDKERNAPLLRLDTTTTTTMRVVASARLSSSLTSARGFVVPERWRRSRHATTTMMRTRRRPEKSIIIIRAMAKKGSKSSNDEPEGFGFPRYAVRKLARLFALRTTRVLLTSWALLTSR